MSLWQKLLSGSGEEALPSLTEGEGANKDGIRIHFHNITASANLFTTEPEVPPEIPEVCIACGILPSAPQFWKANSIGPPKPPWVFLPPCSLAFCAGPDELAYL